VHVAPGLPELAGAAGDGEGQADAVDEELAPAGDDETGVAEHVVAEHDGAARLVAADAVAGLVEQIVGEDDGVARAVAWVPTSMMVKSTSRAMTTCRIAPGRLSWLAAVSAAAVVEACPLPQGRRVEALLGEAAAATIEATRAPLTSMAKTAASASLLRMSNPPWHVGAARMGCGVPGRLHA
jgi:hypothetical protein